MANFQLSESLKKRIKNTYYDHTVIPHWVKDTGAFCYRKQIGPESFSFTLVHAKEKFRGPAFDHARVAELLTERGIKASEDELPFKWVHLSGNPKVVKFHAGDKKWQFKANSILEEVEEDFEYEDLTPLQEEERESARKETRAAITVFNGSAGPIEIYWVDWDGDVHYYGIVKPGDSDRRPTYLGHVWRATKANSKDAIADFVVQYDKTTATIKDVLAAPRQLDKASQLPDSNTDRDSNAPPKLLHAFVRNHNVWARDPDGVETQITITGGENHPYDEKFSTSPDGHFAVVYQYTPEQERKVHLIESCPKGQLQPRLQSHQQLKPGDKVRVDRPRMLDLKNRCEIATDPSLFRNALKIYGMGWSADNREYHFVWNQRGHKLLRVIGINTEGRVRTILEESSETFVSECSWNFLRDTDELIWTSERRGCQQIYLWDMESGQMKNQITSGRYVVRSVDRVEESHRQIWFTAYGAIPGQDPYYAQLARVNFDGTGFLLLTEGDGTHTWMWRPDHKFFVDTWSRVDSAPQSELRDAETGKLVMPLERCSLGKLLAAGWTSAERFAAPGRDGQTLVHGVIICPSDFDPSKKYPVVEKIYAGPQQIGVPKAFTRFVWQHELAELGFVVVQVDGMGTNWRSKAFRDVCYQNLKDAGLPDHIAWMKAAVVTRPWMDLSRVGIYGCSAGGQNALSALLWHGGFYKAAVADSGCHDNRVNRLWWSEQWMGWPVDQAYEDSSNVVHAHRLKGALMLIVGELDTNVDPASTLQVVSALNKAEKDYELLYMPGEGHGVGFASEYACRRARDFFVKHLMDATPPNRNVEISTSKGE